MRERKLVLVVLALLGIACEGNDSAQGSGDLLRSARAGGADDETSDPAAAADPALGDFLERECVRGGGSVGSIEVVFDCDSITVHSCKDLSNVVIELEGGERQRFEGLSSQGGTFSGTGANQGGRVVGVWVKAGNNKSGDGPGYGERFDAPDQDCTPPPVAGSGGTGGACGSDDPDNVCGGAGIGGSGGAGGDDNGGTPVCSEGDPNCTVD